MCDFVFARIYNGHSVSLKDGRKVRFEDIREGDVLVSSGTSFLAMEDAHEGDVSEATNASVASDRWVVKLRSCESG